MTEPEGNGNRGPDRVGQEIAAARVAAGNKRLMELITDAVQETEHDHQQPGPQHAARGDSRGQRKESRSGKKRIKDAMHEFVRPGRERDLQGRARLMGEKKNYPHDRDHGDTTKTALAERHG